MISVVLADDEPIIVRGLKKILNWEKLGVSIVGEAYDGNEAIELVNKLEPDFLISDINMPKKTGIELLQELKDNNSNTKVIFISGYQEFEYAHAAIKYGAIDYLIKPINREQFEAAIVKGIESIRSKSITKDNLPIQTKTLDEEDPILDKVMINKHSKEPIDGLDGYYIALNCHYCFEGNDTIDKGERDIINFSTLNAIESFFEDVKHHWVIDKKDHILILMFNKDEKGLEKAIIDLPYEIVDYVKQNTNQRITISTGKIVDHVNRIKESYIASIDTMKKKFFYENASVIYYNDREKGKYSIEDLYYAQEKIVETLLKYDEKKIRKSVVYYMTILKDVTVWNKASTIGYCLSVLVFIKKKIQESNNALCELEFGDQISVETLKGLDDFKTLQEWMINCIESFYRLTVNCIKKKDVSEIQMVKIYIEEHYSENIKLKDLANLIYMNPNYFSGYFKKHTGVRFKDYLTHIRMKEAEKLLLSSDLKVYEIAERVGFNDYRHFSDIFKHRYGSSPSDYKQKIIGRING